MQVTPADIAELRNATGPDPVLVAHPDGSVVVAGDRAVLDADAVVVALRKNVMVGSVDATARTLTELLDGSASAWTTGRDGRPAPLAFNPWAQDPLPVV